MLIIKVCTERERKSEQKGLIHCIVCICNNLFTEIYLQFQILLLKKFCTLVSLHIKHLVLSWGRKTTNNVNNNTNTCNLYTCVTKFSLVFYSVSFVFTRLSFSPFVSRHIINNSKRKSRGERKRRKGGQRQQTNKNCHFLSLSCLMSSCVFPQKYFTTVYKYRYVVKSGKKWQFCWKGKKKKYN